MSNPMNTAPVSFPCIVLDAVITVVVATTDADGRATQVSVDLAVDGVTPGHNVDARRPLIRVSGHIVPADRVVESLDDARRRAYAILDDASIDRLMPYHIVRKRVDAARV